MLTTEYPQHAALLAEAAAKAASNELSIEEALAAMKLVKTARVEVEAELKRFELVLVELLMDSNVGFERVGWEGHGMYHRQQMQRRYREVLGGRRRWPSGPTPGLSGWSAP